MELFNDHLHTWKTNNAQPRAELDSSFLCTARMSVQVILPKNPQFSIRLCAQRNSEVNSWAPDGLSLVKRMVKSYQPEPDAEGS